jgi:putative DNA primase/helicase
VALEKWKTDDPSGYRGGGLGFVFTEHDPCVGIDLDRCVDPDTGTIALWAQHHVGALASYTEITPSGTGLHVLVEGVLPPHGRKKAQAEMYAYARFFTMSGWQVPGTPPTVEARQDALTAMHTAIFGPPRPPRPRTDAPLTLDDTALLAQARAARNRTKFAALWAGDTTGYGSPSEADLALCCVLALWTHDPAQNDRLFRQSGLMRPKWDAKRGVQTYGERTLAEALARQHTHYTHQAERAPHRLPTLTTRLSCRVSSTLRRSL